MLSLILSLALIGFVVYLVVTYIPMPDIFKMGILVIVAIFVIVYVLRILGIADVALPRL